MVKDVNLTIHILHLWLLYTLYIFILLPGKNRPLVEGSWTSAVRIFLVSFFQVYLLRMVSTTKELPNFFQLIISYSQLPVFCRLCHEDYIQNQDFVVFIKDKPAVMTEVGKS